MPPTTLRLQRRSASHLLLATHACTQQRLTSCTIDLMFNPKSWPSICCLASSRRNQSHYTHHLGPTPYIDSVMTHRLFGSCIDRKRGIWWKITWMRLGSHSTFLTWLSFAAKTPWARCLQELRPRVRSLTRTPQAPVS